MGGAWILANDGNPSGYWGLKLRDTSKESVEILSRTFGVASIATPTSATTSAAATSASFLATSVAVVAVAAALAILAFIVAVLPTTVMSKGLLVAWGVLPRLLLKFSDLIFKSGDLPTFIGVTLGTGPFGVPLSLISM